MKCGYGCGANQIGAPFDPKKKVEIDLGDGASSSFDFLVVACDPQLGLPNDIMQKTAIEKEMFSAEVMKSYYFQTTLMRFPKVGSVEDPVEIFNPVNLNKLEGLLHSYRSETRKEAYQLTAATASVSKDLKEFYANELDKVSHEYVTMYQLVDPETAPAGTPTSQEGLWLKLQEQMRDVQNRSWFPYDASQGTLIKQFNTKYFNHFTRDALKNKPNNWNILNNQGQNNTIYVHASTAFESVLHIYRYIEMLANVCPHSFPSEKGSKIAVVGAGPSGLLISRKLTQMMGYTDVTIFESKPNNSGPNQLYAGKTQTNIVTSQSALDYRIPCELGTCYLSPNYKPMYDDFANSNLLGPNKQDRNDLISLDQIQDGPIVKDIITYGQFLPDGPVNTLIRKHPGTIGVGTTIPYRMNFETYQTVKGFEEHYKGKNYNADQLNRRYPFFLERVMGPAAIKYITYHIENFGTQMPFATKQSRLKNEIFSMDIYSFLKKKKMLSLFGVLQFAYSLQGYGSTEEHQHMSAFYLLVWITPDDFVTFITDTLIQYIKDGLKAIHLNPNWFQNEVPVVAALSKGWGDVWKNLKEQFEEEGNVVINYNTDITSITRDGV